MSKKEIIKEIRNVTGCSQEKAEVIFAKGVANGNIILRVDWEYIINRLIIAAIVVVGLWALWRRLF